MTSRSAHQAMRATHKVRRMRPHWKTTVAYRWIRRWHRAHIVFKNSRRSRPMKS